MLLPLGDAPNPRHAPLVTWALLAANVAVYVLLTLPLSAAAPDPRDPALQAYVEMLLGALPDPALRREVLASISAYDLLVFEYGFRPAAPSLVALLTSPFLHAGLAHLGGNLLFLWIYGDNVEHRLGALRFLAAYVLAGVAATLFHAVAAAGSGLPLIGASGAISGVLGFYFVWFPRNRIRLFLFLPPLLLRTVFVPARLVLAVYLVVDNLLPFVVDRGLGGGIAHGAHIGGFLAGIAGARLVDRRDLQRRPAEYPPMPAAGAAPADRLQAALRAGDFELAAAVYFSLDARATRRLLAPADSLALGAWLRRAGHPHAALAVFRRHVRDFPAGPGLAEAHLGAGLVQLQEFDEPTPAYQHLLAALDAAPGPETAQEARRALAAIDARREHRPLRGAGRP